MYIRFSRESDKSQIALLTALVFGNIDADDALTNLDNRYLLAFDNDKLAAMTGITWNSEYGGNEIEWTCTHPKYRKRGIMSELFRRICELTDEDIYCSCLRLCGHRKVNLHAIMKAFNFKLVKKNDKVWSTSSNCNSGKTKYCSLQKSHMEDKRLVREKCMCHEDMYVRKAIK